MTLRKKLILITIAVAILPMIFIGTLGYYSAKTTLQNLRMQGLKSIADLKVKKIEDFFADQKNHIKIAQLRPNIKKYATLLAEYSCAYSSPDYAVIRDELDRTLKMYPSVYDYTNVMLANPKGKIVYVLNRVLALEEIDRFQPALWQEAFNKGKNKVYISDVFRSRDRAGQLSVYITAPVHNFDGNLTGVIALEIDMVSIFKLVQDATGMGQTGETLIARREGDAALLLNPLRHDPEAALMRKIVFGERQALPIQAALNGKAGQGIFEDYRGKNVIAVWQYIPLLDWGVVVKIDVTEAFEPAAKLRDFVLILTIAVIILSILIALLVSKSITDPIQMLQTGTEEIGRGNLDHKVGTDSRDEIGQLGTAFDQMVEKLKIVTASRDDLNREIDERRKVEKELQKSMWEIDERVKELNCLFEISRLVEKRNLTLDKILCGIIDLIPPAWQYPDITCARIELKGKKFKTTNFRETIWQQVSDVIVHGVPSGKLTVGYLEERPVSDDCPFLKEERELLDAIAERVGRIIERKWAQNALRQSEEKFRELMENMHSGVAVFEAVAGGQDFEIKDFNRVGEKIDNIDRDRVIGRPVTAVLPGVKDFGIFDVIQRVWKTGQPEYFSGGVYQDHRTPPSWRESYVYKLSSGEIVTVYQDVTEQKLAQKALEDSERRFRDLVENSLTGISIVQNNRVVYQNQEQERLLGRLPRSYLLADFEMIHAEDVEKVKWLSQRIDRGEIQTLETEFRFWAEDNKKGHKDLKWVYCRALLTKYRGKEAILVNMIDMTKAKELEHLLNIQDKMASLGRVAAGMAHEIRNPLSGINIYLNTLKKLYHKKGSEDKVKQILGQIESASRKIESVIRRVMDFAKPGEPKLALIDLNRPVSEAINLSAVTMRKSGIVLEKDLAENLPPFQADPNLIEEMVLNLLNNAAEAMKTMTAGKKIIVSSSATGTDIILTVSDSGPGIDPDIRDKIFDPYFTTKSDGTGIGLSISHRIVTDHGGLLTVTNSELGGAEFRVKIPINAYIKSI
jgi:PAS domain S-box-containing protein